MKKIESPTAARKVKLVGSKLSESIGVQKVPRVARSMGAAIGSKVPPILAKQPVKKKVAATVKSASLDKLLDARVNCYSIIVSSSIKDYLALVDDAYKNRGGVEGQREKLRTTSAIRIRKRMVEDIVGGAVLPPVVIGIVLPKVKFKKVGSLTRKSLDTLIDSLESDRISIIDGMQRTTALSEARTSHQTIAAQQMRVEFWISESTNSLIYRMLVLNTGQVPWNLRNQVEVVFKSLIMEIGAAVDALTVLSDGGRRSGGGQFQANELVELFLVFGARKEKIDIRERLADEFTRLDFMEAASDSSFTSNFCDALGILVKLDVIFDTYKPTRPKSSDKKVVRFSIGRDLFASQPACVGLVTAVATEVAGRPGVERSTSEQKIRLSKIVSNMAKLCARLEKLSMPELGHYLGFQTLNEAISRGRSSMSVGDMEREFFLRAFQVLIEENFELKDLTPCWRAY
ncbi:hypothetical protein [Janthinobacterium sp. P210006]|uniref:hypothetical protein n=1 Tax=Janthinobacterium sp. P210006 TaxID=3112939 RepID=UPI002E25DCD9|nr:hypothetical protein [Janthinobacterium sp. P210006]